MMSKQDGGPAFPVKGDEASWTHGMTLRDYFAGQALIGAFHEYVGDRSHGAGNPTDSKVIAEACYFMADAMLKERELLP